MSCPPLMGLAQGMSLKGEQTSVSWSDHRSDGRMAVRNSKRDRLHVRMILRRQVEGTGSQETPRTVDKDPGNASDAQKGAT
jgi:hypothetical protein